MSNGRNTGKKGRADIDGTHFIKMPAVVLKSTAYINLGHTAVRLLWDIALQYVGTNNGSLRASEAYLKDRGWNSSGTIDRAKQELLAAGFIFQTVQGHRPAKASRFALTWCPLDKAPTNTSGYDFGAERAFVRGAYAKGETLKVKPSREELYARHRDQAPSKNTVLTLAEGVGPHANALAEGVAAVPPTLAARAVRAVSIPLSTLAERDLLEEPYTAVHDQGVVMGFTFNVKGFSSAPTHPSFLQ
jgi:hypothetical protein